MRSFTTKSTVLTNVTNNEAPLQRDEVKATFNKDESNLKFCKFN